MENKGEKSCFSFIESVVSRSLFFLTRKSICPMQADWNYEGKYPNHFWILYISHWFNSSVLVPATWFLRSQFSHLHAWTFRFSSFDCWIKDKTRLNSNWRNQMYPALVSPRAILKIRKNFEKYYIFFSNFSLCEIDKNLRH